MKYHLLTGVILSVALTFYCLGLSGLGFIGFFAGGLCELWFWVRLFAKRPADKQTV